MALPVLDENRPAIAQIERPTTKAATLAQQHAIATPRVVVCDVSTEAQAASTGRVRDRLRMARRFIGFNLAWGDGIFCLGRLMPFHFQIKGQTDQPLPLTNPPRRRVWRPSQGGQGLSACQGARRRGDEFVLITPAKGE